jgi:2-oxoglutarate dehydrogenase E2 component (dihydrolipoamide succinyltransferase)
VRSIARKESVSLDELAGIPGSGRGGRVTKRDLTAYLDRRRSSSATSAPSAEPARPISKPVEASDTRMTEDGAIDVVPMDHIRQKIADHMVLSKATSPHVYSVTEADVTRIVRYRAANKEPFFRREGFKLTYTPYFVQAVVRALMDFPYVNASIEGTNILVKRFVNIGLAVDVDYGLIVPVIRRADNLNFLGIARAVHDLANRARTKSLKPDEVTGGTFSITNMGTVGNLFGIPIIAQPQVAILGIGAIQKRVVVRDEAIAMRDMVYLCLSYDHRLIDGAMGGAFIERIVHHLHTMELE